MMKKYSALISFALVFSLVRASDWATYYAALYPPAGTAECYQLLTYMADHSRFSPDNLTELYVRDVLSPEQFDELVERYYKLGTKALLPDDLNSQFIPSIERWENDKIFKMIDQQGLTKVEVGPYIYPICADCYYVEPDLDASYFKAPLKIERKGGEVGPIQKRTVDNRKYWKKAKIEEHPFADESVDLFILKHFPAWDKASDEKMRGVFSSLYQQLKTGGSAFMMVGHHYNDPSLSGATFGHDPITSRITGMIEKIPVIEALPLDWSHLYDLASLEGFKIIPFYTEWYDGLYLMKK